MEQNPDSYYSHVSLPLSDTMISSCTVVADDSFCIGYEQLSMRVFTRIEILFFLTCSQITLTLSSA